MIDLHLHTTASDGRLTPSQLVERVSAAGLKTISVTDHDTVRSIDEVTSLASPLGIRVIPGIEITAVDGGKDVHVLAYFIDHQSRTLATFLERQRALRVDRVREMGARLAALGIGVDVEAVLAPAIAHPGTSVGRPQLARALVASGLVPSIQDAFDQWLAAGQPAYVPRTGPGPADVVRLVHDVAGVASMAHPGVTKRDDLIAPLAADGLDAIEVYHSDHTPDDQRDYLGMAYRFCLAVTGGSDFHGGPFDSPERERPGSLRASPFDSPERERPGSLRASPFDSPERERPGSLRASGPDRPGGRGRRGVLGVVLLPAAAFADLESRARARKAS